MVEIRKKNFLEPNNTVSIQSSSFRALGTRLGKIASTAAKRTVSAISNPGDIGKATLVLSYAENLATTDVCVIQNRNLLREYLDLLYGYCEGAGITKSEGTLLQIELESGCQTVIIQDQISKSIGFLHMEENFDDRDIGEMYKFMDIHPNWNPTITLPEEYENRYQYKMVTAAVGNDSYTFFAYPGLCFGGPAMGFNHKNNSLICVDTISPKRPVYEKSLWANAIATMAYLTGDVDGIRQLLRRLDESHIRTVNGYALHIADANKLTMASFEFGDDIYTEVPADSFQKLHYVVQPNLPRSDSLRLLDELSETNTTGSDVWTKQFALEMTRRIHDLNELVRQCKLIFDASFPEKMSAWANTGKGDLETDMYAPEWKTFTGLISPFVAGYVSGIFTPHDTIVEFGKFYPYNSDNTRPRMWYSGDMAIPPGSKDLLKLVNNGKTEPATDNS